MRSGMGLPGVLVLRRSEARTEAGALSSSRSVVCADSGQAWFTCQAGSCRHFVVLIIDQEGEGR